MKSPQREQRSLARPNSQPRVFTMGQLQDTTSLVTCSLDMGCWPRRPLDIINIVVCLGYVQHNQGKALHTLTRQQTGIQHDEKTLRQTNYYYTDIRGIVTVYFRGSLQGRCSNFPSSNSPSYTCKAVHRMSTSLYFSHLEQDINRSHWLALTCSLRPTLMERMACVTSSPSSFSVVTWTTFLSPSLAVAPRQAQSAI